MDVVVDDIAAVKVVDIADQKNYFIGFIV